MEKSIFALCCFDVMPAQLTQIRTFIRGDLCTRILTPKQAFSMSVACSKSKIISFFSHFPSFLLQKERKFNGVYPVWVQPFHPDLFPVNLPCLQGRIYHFKTGQACSQLRHLSLMRCLRAYTDSSPRARRERWLRVSVNVG